MHSTNHPTKRRRATRRGGGGVWTWLEARTPRFSSMSPACQPMSRSRRSQASSGSAGATPLAAVVSSLSVLTNRSLAISKTRGSSSNRRGRLAWWRVEAVRIGARGASWLLGNQETWSNQCLAASLRMQLSGGSHVAEGRIPWW